MSKRSIFSISLRTLLLFVTAVGIMVGVGTVVYESRYGRNARAHQYFDSLGVALDFGDPMPETFTYYFDATGRGDGMPSQVVTRDFIERIVGRRLSYPPLRELGFRASQYVNNHQFTPDMADRIVELAPGLEVLELPGINKTEKVTDDQIDTMIERFCQLKELRVLSFHQWPITDRHIEKFLKLHRLQVLQFSQPQHITAKSINHFERMKALRFLTISQGEITAKEFEDLRDKRPELVARLNGSWYGDPQLIYFKRNE